jgi:hypothetical protein
MAGFLGQVLTGLGRGYLGNMKEQRAKREEGDAWETEKKRKRETLDMQDEYQQKTEQRKRMQGAFDEEVAYQRDQKREDAAFGKKKSRLEELQNEQLAEIQKLFPDRWSNPELQPQIIAGVKGIKVPALPADKKIAELFMAGKTDEALKLAVNSNNPEDRKFYDDMITTISNQKRLKNLLNPSSGGSGDSSKLYKRREMVGKEINRLIENLKSSSGVDESGNPIDAFNPEQKQMIKDQLEMLQTEYQSISNAINTTPGGGSALKKIMENFDAKMGGNVSATQGKGQPVTLPAPAVPGSQPPVVMPATPDQATRSVPAARTVPTVFSDVYGAGSNLAGGIAGGISNAPENIDKDIQAIEEYLSKPVNRADYEQQGILAKLFTKLGLLNPTKDKNYRPAIDRNESSYPWNAGR